MLADFTASLGNHWSIQGLGSQMPALISIDKGKGGMSKCKTFPSSVELREAAWCREEVESRTSGLYLLLAPPPTCFATLSKSFFTWLPYFLRGRESSPAFTWCSGQVQGLSWWPWPKAAAAKLAHSYVPGNAVWVMATPEGARGVAMPLESPQRKMLIKQHCACMNTYPCVTSAFCYYRLESYSEQELGWQHLSPIGVISYPIFCTTHREEQFLLG